MNTVCDTAVWHCGALDLMERFVFFCWGISVPLRFPSELAGMLVTFFVWGTAAHHGAVGPCSEFLSGFLFSARLLLIVVRCVDDDWASRCLFLSEFLCSVRPFFDCGKVCG